MNISSYEDLLNSANAQTEPQRLLFVFASAELPGDCTEEQRKEFKECKGWLLTPIMCVDRLASDREDFDSLVEESRQTEMGWDIVFVAALGGKSGAAPTSDDAEYPLKVMVKSIHDGNVGGYLAFKKNGELLQLQVE